MILEAAFVARFYNLQIPIFGIVGKQNFFSHLVLQHFYSMIRLPMTEHLLAILKRVPKCEVDDLEIDAYNVIRSLNRYLNKHRSKPYIDDFG